MTIRFTMFQSLSLLMMAMIGMVCCSPNKGRPDTGASPGDTVAVAVMHLTDTSSFVKANGEQCLICAEGNITYPNSYGDTAATARLQRLFANVVLDAGDSLSLDEAAHFYIANSIHQYDFAGVPRTTADGHDDETESQDTVFKYNTTTNVQVFYHSPKLITFNKVEVVKKNDHVTSLIHRYYTFDLAELRYVDLLRLFREDALPEVSQLLRAKLMELHHVTTNEQLNDLGYFNVENLTVTRNFYFDDNGVTWSFLPNELAVEAVGEPKITISYGDLSESLCENSIIERLK